MPVYSSPGCDRYNLAEDDKRWSDVMKYREKPIEDKKIRVVFGLHDFGMRKGKRCHTNVLLHVFRFSILN